MNKDEIQKIVEKVVDSLYQDSSQQVKNVAIGGDHGGFELKEFLIQKIKPLGYNIIDCGTNNKESVDYPTFAAKVARKVASKEAERGIIIDTAGIGSCMSANKIKGVRAALCYSDKTILNSRVHNDANVLTLGAAYHEPEEAFKLAELWLKTEFEGGRHQKRIDIMMDLEN